MILELKNKLGVNGTLNYLIGGGSIKIRDGITFRRVFLMQNVMCMAFSKYLSEINEIHTSYSMNVTNQIPCFVLCVLTVKDADATGFNLTISLACSMHVGRNAND